MEIKLRRFKFYDKQPIDIIILDENGSHYIKYCIPKNSRSLVVKNRGVLPAIKSFKFFILFVKFFVSTRRPGLSSICALISLISPAVIVTFIDNFSGLGHIQSFFPEKKVIAIQNALKNKRSMEIFLRSLKSISNNRKSKIDLPIYFGFGAYEKDIFNYYSLNIKEYIPNGSIRMGIFNTFYLNKLKSKNGIRFISQYRKKVEQSNDSILVHIYEAYKKILQNTLKFSIKNNIDFKIVLAREVGSADLDLEIEYYDSVFGKNEVQYLVNNYKKLSSYSHCYEGEIIINMNSSLGFEFFGNGHKVLFCNPSDEKLLSFSKENDLYNRIPDECLLLSKSYEELSNKITELLSISDENYASLVQKSANYFMKNGEREDSLLRVQNYIADCLDGVSK